MPKIRWKLALVVAALGVSAALLGLLAATEAALRALEHHGSVTNATERETSSQDGGREGAYHDRGAPGWMAP